MVKSISVPKTPRSAYDPTRKVSTLLKAHIANLEAVTTRKLGVKPSRKPRTEAQASAYIAELTHQLHPEVQHAPVPALAAAAAQPPAVMPGVIPGPATTAKTERKTRARKTKRGVVKAYRGSHRTARTRKAKHARGAKK